MHVLLSARLQSALSLPIPTAVEFGTKKFYHAAQVGHPISVPLRTISRKKKQMSEQQNAELIKSVYDAFGRGDLAYILDRLAEDVDWTLEGPAIIPYAGKRKGVAQGSNNFSKRWPAHRSITNSPLGHLWRKAIRSACTAVLRQL